MRIRRFSHQGKACPRWRQREWGSPTSPAKLLPGAPSCTLVGLRRLLHVSSCSFQVMRTLCLKDFDKSQTSYPATGHVKATTVRNLRGFSQGDTQGFVDGVSRVVASYPTRTHSWGGSSSSQLSRHPLVAAGRGVETEPELPPSQMAQTFSWLSGGFEGNEGRKMYCKRMGM